MLATLSPALEAETVSTTMFISRSTVDHAYVDMPGARCLQVSLSRNAAGEPEALTLATAWTDPIRPYGAAVEIPGYLLGELVGALQALEVDR